MEQKFDYRRINAIYLTCADQFPYKKRSVIVLLIRVFLKIFFHALFRPLSYKKTGRMLVVMPTLNNQRSLRPILQQMKFKDYSYVDSYFMHLVPLVQVYWYTLPYLIDYIRLYRSCNDAERRAITNEMVITSAGFYKAAKKLYKKNPDLKVVLYANDHVPYIRCLIEVGREMGVKSIYSQHASVSELFPALSFSYSFLDGVETYEKYCQCGERLGKVFVAGSPRFDVAMSLQHKDENAVGIAYNELDEPKKVVEACKVLREHGYKNIIARPHPGVERICNDWSMFEKGGVVMSFPSKEDPFPFLSRINLLVAGPSSIHLEAALMRVPSIQYNFQILKDADPDCYGYIKRGIMPYAETLEEFEECLKNPHCPSKELVQYYDAAFNTQWHGHVSELVAAFTDALLEGKEDDFISEHFVQDGTEYYKIK